MVSVTWLYMFSVVSELTCPIMAESVFTSMPFSSAIVAKVWRRSWKRTCLQCALSSMMRKRFVIAVGFLGSPSFTGDGKIQSYFAVFFISRSRLSMSGGRRTVLIELLVFGTDMPLVVSCRLIFSSPVSRLRSRHFSPSISPRRIPVVSSRRNIS